MEGHLGGGSGRQEGEETHHSLDWFVGEFGSVREAQLKQEDGSFVKVAVKMLKGEWRRVDVERGHHRGG